MAVRNSSQESRRTDKDIVGFRAEILRTRRRPSAVRDLVLVSSPRDKRFNTILHFRARHDISFHERYREIRGNHAGFHISRRIDSRD